VFFRPVAKLHAEFGTPARAIIIQALLASILVMLGTFNQIVPYFVFITVLFIGLSVGGLFLLRRRDEQIAVYRTPGYPVTPMIFLLLVAGLLLLLAAHNPLQAGLGVGIVALGVPVYILAFRGRQITDGEETA
jgi:APA family basic amino acid/polyamine antiporter